jgi:hypothetical protein
MQILEDGSHQYGLMHLYFGKVIIEPQTVGKPSGLGRMSRNMGLEDLYISQP